MRKDVRKRAILTSMRVKRLEMEKEGLLGNDQPFYRGKSDNIQGETTQIFRASHPINRRSLGERKNTQFHNSLFSRISLVPAAVATSFYTPRSSPPIMIT